MLKSARWSSTPCTIVMALSGGLRAFFGIVLVQAFFGAECAPTPDAYQFYRGFQYPGSHAPDQSVGHQYSAPQISLLYPNHKPAENVPSEDDLSVLIGTDLEVPYPLYKQISESFLSTTQILVLLPNNTIVQVSGYAGLKDVAKVDPDDTKVLISSDLMVPAAIYLRIVLIQPEEVVIRLPDGQILPNQIYQERYGKKLETHDHGGQTYFKSNQEKDPSPFLLVNNPLKGHPHGNVLSTFAPNLQHGSLVQEVDVPLSHEPTVPVSFEPVSHPEPAPVHYLENKPVSPHPEHLLAPYRSEHRLLPSYPEHSRTPFYSKSKPAPKPYHPKPSYPRHAYVEQSQPVSEPKALLPPGIHVLDSSRCNICDPASQGVQVRIFTV